MEDDDLKELARIGAAIEYKRLIAALAALVAEFPDLENAPYVAMPQTRKRSGPRKMTAAHLAALRRGKRRYDRQQRRLRAAKLAAKKAR